MHCDGEGVNWLGWKNVSLGLRTSSLGVCSWCLVCMSVEWCGVTEEDGEVEWCGVTEEDEEVCVLYNQYVRTLLFIFYIVMCHPHKRERT